MGKNFKPEFELKNMENKEFRGWDDYTRQYKHSYCTTHNTESIAPSEVRGYF